MIDEIMEYGWVKTDLLYQSADVLGLKSEMSAILKKYISLRQKQHDDEINKIKQNVQ